jgi:peptide/nickel transport system ATP-binding protein
VAEPPILEIRNLSIDFRTRQGVVRAINHLSFTIAAREIVGLVGESGSGKTISMLACVGLINDPNVVVSGSIRYKGSELVGLSNRALQKIRGPEIAMIFQDPMTAMTPVHTIGWQIAEQIRAHEKVSAKAAKARAIELLGTMGVPSPREQFDRYPHQLSGGLRQRAMIAMALSCNPSLLIADEPTTALDVTVQAQILSLLRDLRENFGSTIILITHDMGVVAGIADTVMVMYAGRLVERGPTQEIFAHPAHPYTQGLIASIPPMEGPRLRRLASIPGTPPNPAAMPDGCAFAPRCPYRFTACVNVPPLFALPAQDSACFLAAGKSA